jgi:hypothetical protein
MKALRITPAQESQIKARLLGQGAFCLAQVRGLAAGYNVSVREVQKVIGRIISETKRSRNRESFISRSATGFAGQAARRSRWHQRKTAQGMMHGDGV